MIDPMPIPDGLDSDGLRDMTVNDGEWRKLVDFACITCGNSAYLNPYTSQIWGCRTCGYTTESIAMFFKDLRQPIQC